MIKERYSKVRESETYIYSNINSVYANVGKKDLIETIEVKDKNGEISNLAYECYKKLSEEAIFKKERYSK